MNRGYEEQLQAARTLLESNEGETYPEETRLFVASLLEMGEDPLYISGILNVQPQTVQRWHEDFMTREEFPMRPDEVSFIRDKNILRADARTIGNVVKRCLEEGFTTQEAAEFLGVSEQTIKLWLVRFARDYNQMTNLLPGCEVRVKNAYVLGIQAKDELQQLIYRNDEIEGNLAAQRRMEYLEQRRA